MPYSRPDLSQLILQAQQDVSSSGLPNVDGFLDNAVLPVLAEVQAGLANGHYGYQDRIAKEAVPWTADGEWLEGWGALKGVLRKPATQAAITGSFAGVPGTVIPAGSGLALASGVAYVSVADATVGGGGTAVVSALAAVAGSSGNAAVGATLLLSSPVPGVSSSGVLTAITAGSDQELDDALKTRVLAAYAAPPQGGDQQDYVEWALAVPGVTRAWCNPNGFGAGTVVVYTMLDVTEAAFGGFPQGSNGVAAAEPRDAAATGDQLTVANAIYPLRPVTALVYACAPVAQAVAFQIHGVTAVPAAVQPLVAAAIDAVFLSRNTPLGGTIGLSAFEAAIAGVAGMPDFTLVAPSGPISSALGYLPVRGAVTYA